MRDTKMQIPVPTELTCLTLVRLLGILFKKKNLIYYNYPDDPEAFLSKDPQLEIEAAALALKIIGPMTGLNVNPLGISLSSLYLIIYA